MQSPTGMVKLTKIGPPPDLPVTTALPGSPLRLGSRPTTTGEGLETSEDRAIRKILARVPEMQRMGVKSLLENTWSKSKELEVALGAQTSRCAQLSMTNARLTKELATASKQHGVAIQNKRTALSQHESHEEDMIVSQNTYRCLRDEVFMHSKSAVALDRTLTTLRRSASLGRSIADTEEFGQHTRRTLSEQVKMVVRENRTHITRITSLEETLAAARKELRKTKSDLRAAQLRAKLAAGVSAEGGDKSAQASGGKQGEKSATEARPPAPAKLGKPTRLARYVRSVEEADARVMEIIKSEVGDPIDTAHMLRQLTAVNLSMVDPEQLNAQHTCAYIVSEAIMSLFNCEAVALFVTESDSDGKQFTWKMTSHDAPEDHGKVQYLDPKVQNLGFAGDVASRGQVIRLANAQTDPVCLAPAVDGVQNCTNYSMLTIPCKLPQKGTVKSDQSLAVLQLINKKPKLEEFSELDEAVATLISIRLALSLAACETATIQRTRSEMLERITEAPELLRQAEDAIMKRKRTPEFTSADAIAMATALTEHAATTLYAQDVRIFLKSDCRESSKPPPSPKRASATDIDDQMWTVRKEIGADKNEWVRVELSVKGSVAGYVLQSGLSHYVELSNNDAHFNPEIDLTLGIDTPTPLVSVPLLHRSRGIVGVMQLVPSANSRGGMTGRDKGWSSATPLTIVDAASMYAQVMEAEIERLIENVETAEDAKSGGEGAGGEAVAGDKS